MPLNMRLCQSPARPAKAAHATQPPVRHGAEPLVSSGDHSTYNERSASFDLGLFGEGMATGDGVVDVLRWE